MLSDENLPYGAPVASGGGFFAGRVVEGGVFVALFSILPSFASCSGVVLVVFARKKWELGCAKLLYS